MRYVTLLGGQSVSDADGTVRVRSTRTVALIAFLVVHAEGPQPRHRIAGLFWPDSTDEQALTNLRRELHHLRGALGDDPCLVATSKDLGWQDTSTCQVDVRVFERERRAALAAAHDDDRAVLAHATVALEAYRGELLPGSDDDWLLEARAELERRCVDLIDRLGETRVRTGDLTGAIEAAHRRLRLRPLEEVGYRTLMERQGDLGDRAGAVRTYHQCASVLERELGIAPDPATRAALNRLLARAGPASDAAPTNETPPRRTGLAAAHLVGRSAELDVLGDLWRTAAGGRPRLALVRGDAGVGKTRLVAEVTEAARSAGAVVAGTQCFGTSGRLALSPVADWLRTPEIQSGLRELDPVWRVEVDRLVPSGTARGQQPAATPRALVDAWQRHRFFEGLTRALLAVGRPTLLVVDNLHWCDQETLAFLTFCLALIPDAPVMVAATMRDDDQEHEPGLAHWIVRMRAAGILTELALRPLETEETAALSEAVTGRPVAEDDLDLLQATTGGFPLHVVEVARSTTDPAGRPPSGGDLASVLRSRLEQASAPARDVAGLAAAVGRTFGLDLLTEASDLDADGVVRAVDELWRRRILREVGEGYDFSHDLLRDAAYATVSPPKRWLLHRRVAQGLELLEADDPDAVSAQLAEQYARGGRGRRAVGYYRRAAEVAADRFAHGEAVRLHTEALAVVRALPAGRDRDVHELGVLEVMAAPLTARDGTPHRGGGRCWSARSSWRRRWDAENPP